MALFVRCLDNFILSGPRIFKRSGKRTLFLQKISLFTHSLKDSRLDRGDCGEENNKKNMDPFQKQKSAARCLLFI
ncbi:MAG: hypothetical protein CMP91_07480 [Gammaproteobacteria bacterium]|nr:hypothetical protein [Gammaproteobacteria bacterium]